MGNKKEEKRQSTGAVLTKGETSDVRRETEAANR